MKSYLDAVGNLYLYSSLHIALCAVGLSYESYVISNNSVDNTYLLFIGFSTLGLYSLHRLIGISKVKAFKDQGRFFIIEKFKRHIVLYFLMAVLASIYLYFQLDLNTQIALLIPSAIAVAYSLPIFPKGKRLRDYHYIKIILVSLIWACLTTVIPLSIQGFHQLDLILFVERFFFMFAITIPFEVRDFEVDQKTGVKTIAHHLGKEKSLLYSKILLIIALILSLLYTYLLGLASIYQIILLINYGLAFVLISNANNGQKDWYFGGLIDGVMLLRGGLICLVLLF